MRQFEVLSIRPGGRAGEIVQFERLAPFKCKVGIKFTLCPYVKLPDIPEKLIEGGEGERETVYRDWETDRKSVV